MAPMPPIGYIEQLATTLRRHGTGIWRDVRSNIIQGTSANAFVPTAMKPSHRLSVRDESKQPFHPGQGAVSPSKINMQGMLALFAFIGAVFVLAAIWFFFWAKNGGFQWRENDWEEYKSTVLRRKGPDGRTLTNATKSTKLGGGSIVGRQYHDYDDQTTAMETATVVTEKKSRGKRFKESAKQKLLKKRKDDVWEGSHDEDVRAYRNEKPARVGGMNREPDGTYHGTEYSGTLDQRTEWTHSEMGETHAETETRYDPPDAGRARGTRTVSTFSFVPGTEDSISNAPEERYSRDSRNRRENYRTRSQNPPRPQGPRPSTNTRSRPPSPRKKDGSVLPGGYTPPLDMSSITASEYTYDRLEGSDNGTKSYHHPIPGLSKGYRRAGGGRGRRRDSLSDSEGDDYDSRLS
ncbi:hypothetical protein LOZ35_001465 [Ophidiomyces ophidiicola]|nr:hypothetical protein LOZ35_001465 [Ophidiomyces ophidiicola]